MPAPVPPSDRFAAERLSDESLARRAAQVRSRARHFIRGPLPLPWFERAAALPGKALAVGLLLWFKTGMTGPGPVPLSPALLARFGVGRKAACRALDALESAGLVTADRSWERAPRVTFVTELRTER